MAQFSNSDYNANKNTDKKPVDIIDDSFTSSYKGAWQSAGGSGDPYGNYMNKQGPSKLWGNAQWQTPGQRSGGGMYNAGLRMGQGTRAVGKAGKWLAGKGWDAAKFGGGLVAGGIGAIGKGLGQIGEAWQNKKDEKWQEQNDAKVKAMADEQMYKGWEGGKWNQKENDERLRTMHREQQGINTPKDPFTGGLDPDPDATFSGSAEMWADNKQPQGPNAFELAMNPTQDTEEIKPVDYSGQTDEVPFDYSKQESWSGELPSTKEKGAIGVLHRLLPGGKSGWQDNKAKLTKGGGQPPADWQNPNPKDTFRGTDAKEPYQDMGDYSGETLAPANEQPGNIGIKPKDDPYMYPEESVEKKQLPFNQVSSQDYKDMTPQNQRAYADSSNFSGDPKTLSSLGDYVSKFAPDSENDTAHYIQSMADSLGVSPTTPFHELDSSKVAEFQTKMEGGTGVKRNKKGDLWHNPGNLKYAGQPGSYEDPETGFAVFESADAGKQALIRQIKKDQGRSKKNSIKTQGNAAHVSGSPVFNNKNMLNQAWSNTMFKEGDYK